ncbi:DM9 repeat-containing protein [Desulfovibrio ferrophilus]|uniref:DNA-directed RNA polymerase n=1 Tax=Desulfovibrio ferrophilus TaxID=241368 RepID=A0A2Z6AUC3_9BACT|nr:DM9 repeat-containing protein [Desulfovibrio ferrophilus]BBD06828.1 DNA-directed RNA polymerase [Desulfovibrio ferrophilus]
MRKMCAKILWMVVAIWMLMLLSVAGNGFAGDWGSGKNGGVPKSAHSIENGVYAVKAKIPTTSGSHAYYPGTVSLGENKAEIYGQAQKYSAASYDVYLPKAKWCKGGATMAPKGAVQFGQDGGPLYFIRARIGGKYCYGTFGAVIGAPYVYCGNMPQEAYSYEALCK